MKSISNPVGTWEKGAANLYNDVVTVQQLLETAAAKTGKSAFDPQGVDGKIARPPRVSDTIKAIYSFQKTFMANPDGLIEPNRTTLNKLNELDEQGSKNIVDPPPSPAVSGQLFFPFDFVPQYSYKTDGRRFGARRASGTRKHAGCDLIAPEGTKIYAIDDGTLVRGPYHFYRGTYAIEVQHQHFVARYCEIKNVAPGLRRGDPVRKGQVIAYVGKMFHSSMLHFELYQGLATGPLTQRSNTPYQRRSDLLDPTPYLDAWRNNLPSSGDQWL